MCVPTEDTSLQAEALVFSRIDHTQKKRKQISSNRLVCAHAYLVTLEVVSNMCLAV